MVTATTCTIEEQPATALQGWVLVVASYLSMVAAVAIGPGLPKMAQYFQRDPQVGVLISLVATLPALFVALLSAPFGFLADRIGRKRLLLAAVSVYGFCGMAPLLLNSLRWIVVSRAGVGITEAAVMTCGTALLGDYFHGAARERWLACQTGSSTVAAILVVAIAGALGESTWRAPFGMYAVGFVLLPLVAFALWEPSPLQRAGGSSVRTKTETTPTFRWGGLLFICLVTFFGSTAFYVVVVQLSFILTERGIPSTSKIGMAASLASLGVPVGSLLFGLLRWKVAGKLASSFALWSAGFFVISLCHSYVATVLGAAVSGLGSGMALPTFITWALSKLTVEVRGRGTGAWTSAMFFGQFLSPLIILALKNLSGSLAGAVLVYAIACAAVAGVAAGCCFRPAADRRRYHNPHLKRCTPGG
jgi:MFS family permease